MELRSCKVVTEVLELIVGTKPDHRGEEIQPTELDLHDQQI